MSRAKMPNYDGNIYPPENGRIAGWLADLNALDTAVDFELLLDGRSLGQFRADHARPSLLRRGLGHGNYGFETFVKDRHLGANSRISVRPLTEIAPVLQRTGPDETGLSKAPTASIQDIIRHVSLLGEDDVLRLVGGLTQGLLRGRARNLFRAKDWGEMNRFAEEMLSEGVLNAPLLCTLGRGALYARNYPTARLCLALAGTLDPTSTEVLLYRGLTETKVREFDKAIRFLKEAVELNPADTRVMGELCTALRGQLTRQAGDPVLIEETVTQCRRLLDMDRSLFSLSAAGKALLQAGQPAEVLAIMEAALPDYPDEVEILHIKSRALVALGRVAEALDVADEVLRIAPHNQTANFQKRTLGELAASGGVPRLPEFGYLDLSEVAEAGGDLSTALARRREDWLVLNAPEAARPSLDPVRLDRLVDPFLGHQVIDAGAGPITLWRRAVLVDLLKAELVGPALEGLDRLAAFYGARVPAQEPRRAILMSSYGAFKFGGAEQFLESMAHHYQTRGYEPIIVGYVEQYRGERGVTPAGFRYVFIEKTRTALLRLLVEEQVSLVHAVSGAGFLTAETTEYTPIRLIYGIHYWREFLGAEGDERYFDAEGAPIPRPEFRYILRRASSVYVNSDFTRQLLEQTFGVRAPVVYSVPADREEEDQS